MDLQQLYWYLFKENNEEEVQIGVNKDAWNNFSEWSFYANDASSPKKFWFQISD